MKKHIYVLLIVLFANAIHAQTPYVGQVKMFAGNFPPRGWAFCDGQLLSISENEVLFTLIGTTYGGDGQTTFAVPDLRGRVVVGTGQGAGLSSRILGETGGSETNTMTINQMPTHNHFVNTVTANGNQNLPTGNFPAGTTVLDKEYSNGSANTTFRAGMLSPSGNNQPINNIQPCLAVSFIIALEGIFPSQN
ncbi:MAG: tail fiber protein [Bacteroidota bacterium]